MSAEVDWTAIRKARRAKERWEGLGWLLGAAVLCVWGFGAEQYWLVLVGLCLVGNGLVGLFGWGRTV